MCTVPYLLLKMQVRPLGLINYKKENTLWGSQLEESSSERYVIRGRQGLQCEELCLSFYRGLGRTPNGMGGLNLMTRAFFHVSLILWLVETHRKRVNAYVAISFHISAMAKQEPMSKFISFFPMRQGCCLHYSNSSVSPRADLKVINSQLHEEKEEITKPPTR